MSGRAGPNKPLHPILGSGDVSDHEEGSAMQMLKKIGWVILAGALMSFPASLYLSSNLPAPLWYVVLSSFAQALGMGLVAIFFGVITVVARRNKEKGGMKMALIVMACVSAFTSYAVISLSLRA